ncbi:hypothetical protein GGI02_001270 [Coemansia sp. RSA 2322]|nr:hypothetical protein GGI02_001270 [Coemansia sp. RSA 2322]
MPQAANNNMTDDRVLRYSRSSNEIGEQFKTELLRHRRVMQCPWNALAVLLFYKWHVLKEPTPDFSNSAWMSEPLFRCGTATSDEHLINICGDHYQEYQQEIESGKQTYKFMSTRTRSMVEEALSASPLLRNTVSSSKSLCMTRRVLQNGVYENALVSAAGFPIGSDSVPYSISRHVFKAPVELEESIFPFADYLPESIDGGDNGTEMDQRLATVGFCNMLKTLRTALLQDSGLLMHTPFYCQMLKKSCVFKESIFHDAEFLASFGDICENLTDSDYMPMYASIPRDIRLSHVVPENLGCAAAQPVTACAAPNKDSPPSHRPLQRQPSKADIEPPPAKRQRTEDTDAICANLDDGCDLDLPATPSQRDLSPLCSRSMTAPTALESVLMIENEDGNFFEMHKGAKSAVGSFYDQQGCNKGTKSAPIELEEPAPKLSSCLNVDNGQECEGEPPESIAGDTLTNPTPDSVSVASLPEPGSADGDTRAPIASCGFESETNDRAISSASPGTLDNCYAVQLSAVIAHRLSVMCGLLRQLIHSDTKVRKKLDKIYTHHMAIVTRHSQSARTIVGGPSADSAGIDLIREQNKLLRMTGTALVGIEKLFSQHEGILRDLVGSGLEEALENASAFLSNSSNRREGS